VGGVERNVAFQRYVVKVNVWILGVTRSIVGNVVTSVRVEVLVFMECAVMPRISNGFYLCIY